MARPDAWKFVAMAVDEAAADAELRACGDAHPAPVLSEQTAADEAHRRLSLEAGE